jgi:hypothetical protein
MKFGVREICDVVLRAKGTQMIGSKKFYKDEPVLYFDSLKTSTMEGAATTVYAQGGRGNSRLIAWEGERTVTFTMEDALISAAGIAILTGADIIEASSNKKMHVHATQTVGIDSVKIQADSVEITLGDETGVISTNAKASIYVMVMKDGEIISEPYVLGVTGTGKVITVPADNNDLSAFDDCDAVFVDYYEEKDQGYQIDITPDKFGGNYYLEASTLFRNTDGQDLPAEFIIPNCKVQSNFTFTMASSGDPSTFTFTMDAFPDYTRFDDTKKVLSAIQVIEVTGGNKEVRTATAHDYKNP